MNRKRGLIFASALIFAVFFITSISIVSASITFANIQPTYSLGDIINVEISVNPIQEEYMVKTDFICDDINILSFNSMPDESGKVNLRIPLSLNTMNDKSGSCYFKSVYAEETQASRRFEVSNSLEISLNVNSFFINPGQEIEIAGTAARSNGANANGIVEIKIPILVMKSNVSIPEGVDRTEYLKANLIEKDEIFSGTVSEGIFSVKRTFASDIPAGTYKIEVKVYEVSSTGKTTNAGTVYGDVTVSQVLTKVDVILDKLNVNPGESISFTPILIDQAGYEIKDDVANMIKTNSSVIYENIVKSGESFSFDIPTNMTSSYYQVKSSNKNMNVEKSFFVNEKAKVSFIVANESLIVTNVGNIPYEKDIEIDLNNKSFIKHISLELGETKRFELTGLDERYDVRISDGENEIMESGIVLTGGVVGVSDLKSGGALIMSQPIVWIFLIIIVIAAIFFFYRNYLRKSSIAKPFEGMRKPSPPGVLTLKTKEDGEVKKHHLIQSQAEKKEEKKAAPAVHHMQGAPTEAEQTLVKDGQKSNSTVLLIKIKSPLTQLGKETIERAVDIVYDKRAAVMHTRDFVYVIFSPLLTKSFKNELIAAKCAERIIDVIKDYNDKFKERIHFGIGIHSGEMVNKIENRKLKFTAMGSLLPIAKKLADHSHETILLSKPVYEKAMTEIKADKKHVDGTEAYEIKKIVDYEKNKKFIDDFLRRQSRK